MFIAKEGGIMCKLTKEEEYSIISRTMTNIRSLRMYVRGVYFEQLLDMQEKLNAVIEDAVKMLNVRNWKLNVNRYLTTSVLWGLTRKNGRVQFLLLQGQRKPNENPKAV
nr:h-NS histone family protein [Escherichia coli]